MLVTKSKILPALLMLATLHACSAGTQSVSQRLEASRMAFGQGEVLQAYRGVQEIRIEEDQSLASEYEKLSATVTAATEYLVERWLEQSGFWVEQGDLIEALRYYDDLISRLPAGDPLQRMLTEKSKTLRERRAGLERELASMGKQARTDFADGQVDAARQKLLEARWQAQESNLEFALADARLLEECDRRLPGRVEELEEELAPESHVQESKLTKAGKKRLRKRHSRIRYKRGHRPRVSVAQAVATVPIDPAPVPRVPDAEKLFVLGRKERSRGDKVAAIVTFRRVLAADPNHAGAKQALRQLEKFRKKQIAKWMKKAAAHFASEELDRAAPFYRLILKLDPDNLRAKEGIQMHRRLSELKQKQK